MQRSTRRTTVQLCVRTFSISATLSHKLEHRLSYTTSPLDNAKPRQSLRQTKQLLLEALPQFRKVSLMWAGSPVVGHEDYAATLVILPPFCHLHLNHHRSGGELGASVDTLRGTKGACFEAYANVCRGDVLTWRGFFGNRRSKNKCNDRYIVVKGHFCFVFENKTAASPSFAIPLHGVSADNEKGSNKVKLQSFSNVDYVIRFEKADKTTDFIKVVRQAAAAAETEEVRKKLGHEKFLHKRSSLRFAEPVATQKTTAHPVAPVSVKEILTNMHPIGTPL